MPSRRRVLAALAGALVFAPGLAVAAPADTPEALVAAAYARVTAGDGRMGGSEITEPEAVGRWFTRDVVKRWAAANAKAEKDGDIGPVDFDLLTDSQDPEVRRVAIEPREATADAAVVRVGLFAKKKGKPGEKPYTTLDFVLKRQDGAWRIDDVRKPAGEFPWSLRGLIAAAQ